MSPVEPPRLSATAVTAAAGTPQDEDGDDVRARPERSAFAKLFSSTPFYIFLVDVALVVVFGLASHNQVFWSLQNAQAIMGNGAEALLLASGLTLLLAAGLFDLSLGANLILASVIGGLLLAHLTDQQSLNASVGSILLGLVVCLGVGALVGLVNGVLVTALKVNSLIATLGTLGICTGVGFVLAHGSDVSGVPINLQGSFGLATVVRIPLIALLALAVVVVFWVLLRYSRFGTRTLAIGSNPIAASRAGLKVSRHTVILFVIAGVLAGLAGFIDLARFDTTNTSGHTLDALAALTAAVVGGTRLQGGRATIFGTLWGTVLAYVLLDGLVVVGLSSFYQQIATGGVLIVAVAIDSYRAQRRA